MAELSLANILSYGDQLRAVNGEIKSTLAEIGRRPVGSTPYAVAMALHNLQLRYNEARELYTTIYRAVSGSVPTGLGVLNLAAVPIAAWVSLVLAMGVVYTMLQALRDAIQKWREGQAGSLQLDKLSVLQANLDKALASGDQAAADFYRQQLTALAQQGAMPPFDFADWLASNALYVGIGALALVFLMSGRGR